MNKTQTISLDDAVKAARELPAETQEALARELMDRVEDYATPDRPADRQAIIEERLSKPLSAISRDELMAMLRRYNPTL